MKLEIFQCNKPKYEQNKDLKKLLLSTGNKMLVEASPYDDYWGIGKEFNGENKLGKILMKVREKLGGEKYKYTPPPMELFTE